MDLSGYSDAELEAMLKDSAPADQPQVPDLSGYSDAELEAMLGQQQPSAPQPQAPAVAQPPQAPSVPEDVAKSTFYRGLPEGIAAVTPLGFSLNMVRGISDLGRAGVGEIYKKVYGEELPHYTKNPVPTSSDVLKFLSKEALGKDLYEPKTIPGEYANTLTQFASGGIASGAPLRPLLAAGLASETAGQATRGTDWETPARILGGLVGGGLVSSRGNSRAPLKTSEDVRAGASNLYKLAEQKGGVLPSEFTQKWVDNAQNILPQTKVGRTVLGDTPSTRLVSRLEEIKNEPLTLRAAQEIDSALGELMDANVNPRTGKLAAEGNKFYKIQKQLRDQIAEAKPQDIVGGKEGFDTWKAARSEWSKAAKLNDVERILARAEGADNPTTLIKNGFRNLANNPERMRSFSREERKAIKEAAKTGVAGGALKFAGGRLMSGALGTIAGAAGGGPAGAVVGGIAGGLGGTALRNMSESLQRQRANRVLNTVLGDASSQSLLDYALKTKLQGLPFRPESQMNTQFLSSTPAIK